MHNIILNIVLAGHKILLARLFCAHCIWGQLPPSDPISYAIACIQCQSCRRPQSDSKGVCATTLPPRMAEHEHGGLTTTARRGFNRLNLPSTWTLNVSGMCQRDDIKPHHENNGNNEASFTGWQQNNQSSTGWDNTARQHFNKPIVISKSAVFTQRLVKRLPVKFLINHFQCVDTVGCASGRASGL